MCVISPFALFWADDGYKANYGQRNSTSEAAVKAVYIELGLKADFEKYEEESYKKIIGLIESIPAAGGDGLKREVFKSFLDKVYKRSK